MKLNQLLPQENFENDKAQLQEVANEFYLLLGKWSEAKGTLEAQNYRNTITKHFINEITQKVSRLQVDLMALCVLLGDASLCEDESALEILLIENNHKE